MTFIQSYLYTDVIYIQRPFICRGSISCRGYLCRDSISYKGNNYKAVISLTQIPDSWCALITFSIFHKNVSKYKKCKWKSEFELWFKSIFANVFKWRQGPYVSFLFLLFWVAFLSCWHTFIFAKVRIHFELYKHWSDYSNLVNMKLYTLLLTWRASLESILQKSSCHIMLIKH